MDVVGPRGPPDVQVRRLCLRALFLLLAANVLVRERGDIGSLALCDIALVVEAFLHFDGLRFDWSFNPHLEALDDNGPNTVAAVAASCVVEAMATAGFRSESRGESIGVLSGLVSLDQPLDCSLAGDRAPVESGLVTEFATSGQLAGAPRAMGSCLPGGDVKHKLRALVKFILLNPVCAVLSELLALAAVYGAVLGFAYAGPLFLVSMSHAVVGAAVVGYAFAYDFLTLPWRLFSGDMKEIWIAVPVVNACVLWTVLYTCIVIGYFWLVSRRYPELEPQRGRYRAKVLEQMPHQVAARIIGMAQNGGLKMRPEVEMDDMPLNTELEAQQEKCIINDEGLMLLCGAKVLLCLSLPLVQLCVVVAAQVYLGESAWNAANLTFQERTWQHYMHSLSRFALERPLSLAWLYV
ncbi:unnamed protein product [Effrenium voratum]|nr:unnamed protein product [Effrenium voratum]